MTVTSQPEHLIAAEQLADRLARGERITVLDVREDVTWRIEGPALSSRQVTSAEVLADPASLAADLSGPVAVVCNRGETARPVARALRDRGVDAMVLRDGMRGWILALQSRPVDIGLEAVAVRQIQRPARGCLSYLIAADGQALVVDPAPDADFYLALAGELDAQITGVFDTHLHADHLSGGRSLSARAGAKLLLPAPAIERGVAYAQEVTPVHDHDTVTLGSFALRAIALPGHTTDMMGLLLAGRALIGGDSLFLDGIARPDLQRGDAEGAAAMARILHATLRERVLALGDEVILLPGHTHPGVRADAVVAQLGEVRQATPELAIDDPDLFAEALLSDMPPRPANYEAIIAVNAGIHPFDPELEAGANSCATR